MAYIAQIHRPSSIRHAVKLNLMSPEDSSLVVAKANKIEIWTYSEEGLVMFSSKSFHGRVSMLAKIRPYGSSTDHLLIGTSRFKYFTAAWNHGREELETVNSFEDLSDRHMRELPSRDACLVDPTGRYVMLELFEGVINLIKILKPKKGRGDEDYLDKAEQIRLSELRVRASTFLFTETQQPKIALLYTEGKGGNVRLATYQVVDDKGQYSSFNPIKDRENELDGLDFSCSHLIPVPKGDRGQKRYMVRNSLVPKALLGGIIVVSESSMTYLDDESNAVVKFSLDEPSIFVAWEQMDGLNYILADAYARLFLLTILVDGPEVVGMKVRHLGKTTKASQIVLLKEELVFIASHEGDSQLIKISLDQEQDAITIIQTIPNIAPILDFTVMDIGGLEGESKLNQYSSGQAQLVTGSGVNECGSLRSVRSGVGLEDEGILADIQDVMGVFALSSNQTENETDILLVSLPVETRIFKFNSDGDIEELDDFMGLSLDETSLLAMNIDNGLILQVTPSMVKLVGSSPEHRCREWKPPNGQHITIASANLEHLLLSFGGATLVSLEINNGLRVIEVQRLCQDDQIACIHVPFQNNGIGVVGFWKSGTISILDLQDLSIIQSEVLRKKDDASVPRDLALVQILPVNVSGPTLFVSMEDGIVLTFKVDPVSYALFGKKSIVLGTQQARFFVLPQSAELSNIFVAAEHPSLIYGSEGRIIYSAVTTDSISFVCPFQNGAYPNNIIVATDEALKISRVDKQRRTHVRTLPMGVTVRRIAYSLLERAFGLGCIKRELIGDQETVSCSFVIVEDVLFNQVGQEFQLDRSDEIIECVIRAELPTTYQESLAERFIVGTSFLDDNSSSNERGRILVFGIDSSRSPYLISSFNLSCACRQLAVLHDQIVAALVKTVVVYSYLETTTGSADFTKVATYRCSTCPIDIVVNNKTIAVADLQKSLVLLEYHPSKDGKSNKLVEIARHYQAYWATAASHLGDESYLESDQEGNLIILRRNIEGLTAEDKRRLNITGEFHLGEMVNRIQRVQMKPKFNAVVIPRAFLATTEGSIYLLSAIPFSTQDLLFNLQNSIASHVKTLGNIDFNSYRSFRNKDREATEPFRFVDGELIERFLDQDEIVQRNICTGLGQSVEDIRDLVEELKRLH
ncbi:DNA damage-binding protein 1a [Golovinomyces cichoracearum]|uniref:DNA damage-binding protein 1a n=1 Tax=Golovinomyces cichoracearum TaxID=62708 RepID=A0A420HCE2_9PEZI|nr:DNA damage-binding protein 1a [Golovinomyces cichoracearum]